MPKIRVEYEIVTVTTYREEVEVDDIQTAVNMAGVGELGDDYQIDQETTEVKARKVWVGENGEWVQKTCPDIDWVDIGLPDFDVSDMTFGGAPVQ